MYKRQAANALAGLSGVIFAPMSFLVYFGLSFLIPSTSGMATVSMPIMGPLAVKLGFSPAVSYTHLDVYKRQFLDGPAGRVHLVYPAGYSRG